ncbi:MAG: type II toxin-antitoxin system VapC family toxin [Candidatus Acidiferrales bacterium]
MKLLLDTHIWIWSQLEVERLAERVLRELNDEANELWISPISIWELILLVRKGRVVLQMEPYEWIEETLKSGPLREAPLTKEVVLATREVQLPHRDPADHFLAASSKVFGLTLVTADARLLAAKGLSTMANR